MDTTFTLPHTVSHFAWEKSITIDDTSRTATVTTFNGDRYVFDFTSGSIISARRPMRIAALTIAGFLLFVAPSLLLEGAGRVCWTCSRVANILKLRFQKIPKPCCRRPSYLQQLGSMPIRSLTAL